MIDDLTASLTRAIEELTRPVDAIKHQAKTVTVGISRNDEGVLDRALVQAALAAGAGRDALSYHTLKVLADLDPAVQSVIGFTRYRIDGDPAADAQISIVDRGGISLQVSSRVETQPAARRHQAARRRRASGAGGSWPQRRPHRDLRPRGEVRRMRRHHAVARACSTTSCLPRSMRGVLQGYDHRYDRLVDWVTETEGVFRDDLLGEFLVADLLIAPISEAADKWRD